jgi:toxin-antitoxin system PIN domain toxin
MTYLLDVNALLALGVVDHEFHARVSSWMRQRPGPRLATCSITEIGFVRLASQISAYGFTVAQAISALSKMKGAAPSPFLFLADGHDASLLPSWVKSPKQITDGHLAALATTHGARLATLDEGIPGAYLIERLS